MAANMFYEVTHQTRLSQWATEEAGMSAASFCVLLAVVLCSRYDRPYPTRAEVLALVHEDTGSGPEGLRWLERNGFIDRLGPHLRSSFRPTARGVRTIRALTHGVSDG